MYDSETGQPFFHPKIGRGPKQQIRPDPREGVVGQMLYEQVKTYQEKANNRKRAKEEEERSKSNMVFTKDHTNRIIERKKLTSFSYIFAQLDSDSDG